MAEIVYNGKTYTRNNSKWIDRDYEAHKDAYDGINVDFAKAVEIAELLNDNIWFDYFVKTLDKDLGWIDFEKEISTVIDHLDSIIFEEDETVYLSPRNIIPQEDSRTNSKEMKEFLGYMARHHEDLEKSFTDEQKEIFEKLVPRPLERVRESCRGSNILLRIQTRRKIDA